MVQTKHCGEKIKEYDWLVCNMRTAVLQYANCFLRFAFFLSIRYSVSSCVGCFIYDSKKTTDLIRINLNFCVLYIGRSNCIATFRKYISSIHLNPYICKMKKEFGKWLMDVAKYMVTALLLSSIFGDMSNPLVLVSVVMATASTLGAGLWLVRNERDKEN